MSRGPAPRPMGIVMRPPMPPAQGSERSSIFVRGLQIDALIGVHAHEKHSKQPLIIDVEIELSASRNFESEKIGDTINYEAVVTHAQTIAESGHVFLVETFAERLAAACLSEQHAQAIKVRIEKPRAFPSAAAAGVEITRRRK